MTDASHYRPLMDGAADAIIVLGGGIEPDGSLPRVAQARVDRAVELFENGVAPYMIFSGRCGLGERGDPAVTEAAAMARHARERGIPEEALLLEEESKDTLGNAYFTWARYLEPNDWASVRIVTSDYHMSRAFWVFQKILGTGYDFSMVGAPSGLSPHDLILRVLEECKIIIFLNEWLEAVEEGDEDAIDRLIRHEHPGYADAPTLTHEELSRRMTEIARINQLEGSATWIKRRRSPRGDGSERRSGRDRRRVRPRK